MLVLGKEEIKKQARESDSRRDTGCLKKGITKKQSVKYLLLFLQ